MIDDLARHLRFDPLLAAAIILALTLVLGRLVDLVRARRERKRDQVGQGAADIARRFERTDVSASPES